MKTLILITFLLTLAGSQCCPQDPLSDEFIECVGKKATTWKVGRNFHRDTSLKFLKNLMGVLPNANVEDKEHHLYEKPLVSEPIPKNFDAREKWSYCPTIGEIRDQGSCGSCWAVSSVEIMSDRTCIASEGQVNFHYSSEDLISCCSSCGKGCQGGWPNSAFHYWVESGIVSGGPYNSSQGCAPYEIPSCEHFIDGPKPGCDNQYAATPKCKRECEEGYPIQYEEDLHKGLKWYYLNSVDDAMTDLAVRGSISAVFDVYEDFLHYKSGVYQKTRGSRFLGLHAIRIIGYGEEDGVLYWLCANSWNADWGNNGFFKILRGGDECDIENGILSALPLL